MDIGRRRILQMLGFGGVALCARPPGDARRLVVKLQRAFDNLIESLRRGFDDDSTDGRRGAQ